jgi:uncharacterized membrane protein
MRRFRGVIDFRILRWRLIRATCDLFASFFVISVFVPVITLAMMSFLLLSMAAPTASAAAGVLLSGLLAILIIKAWQRLGYSRPPRLKHPYGGPFVLPKSSG